MEANTIIVSTADNWDKISRRWKQRKVVQNISLFIVDELHLLGGGAGPTIEVLISRMRYMATQLENNATTRIVGLGSSLANAKEIGDWMGVSSKCLFNFAISVRPVPLEVNIQSIDTNNFSARLMAMGKPIFNGIRRNCNNKPSMIFVPSRRQAQLTSIDMMTYSSTENGENGVNFLEGGFDAGKLEPVLKTIKEGALAQTLARGIGFVHEGMNESDKQVSVCGWVGGP